MVLGGGVGGQRFIDCCSLSRAEAGVIWVLAAAAAAAVAAAAAYRS
jgi:hypothetical protein